MGHDVAHAHVDVDVVGAPAAVRAHEDLPEVVVGARVRPQPHDAAGFTGAGHGLVAGGVQGQVERGVDLDRSRSVRVDGHRGRVRGLGDPAQDLRGDHRRVPRGQVGAGGDDPGADRRVSGAGRGDGGPDDPAVERAQRHGRPGGRRAGERGTGPRRHGARDGRGDDGSDTGGGGDRQPVHGRRRALAVRAHLGGRQDVRPGGEGGRGRDGPHAVGVGDDGAEDGRAVLDDDGAARRRAAADQLVALRRHVPVGGDHDGGSLRGRRGRRRWAWSPWGCWSG